MATYEVDFDLPAFGLTTRKPAADDGWIPDEELRKISPTFDAWLKRFEAQNDAEWEGREPEPVDDLSIEELEQVERDKQAYVAKNTAPDEPDLDDLTASQRKAVQQLRESQDELFEALTAALREHARAGRPQDSDEPSDFDELFDEAYEEDRNDEFESSFGVQRVLVLDNGTIAIVGWADWEEEHGFGAFMRGDAVLKIGYQSLVEVD